VSVRTNKPQGEPNAQLLRLTARSVCGGISGGYTNATGRVPTEQLFEQVRALVQCGSSGWKPLDRTTIQAAFQAAMPLIGVETLFKRITDRATEHEPPAV